MLQVVRQLQQRLIEISEDEEEVCLELAQEYESLISEVKSQSNSIEKTTVFSREDILVLQEIKQTLVKKLKIIKNHKKQELMRIRTGKEMQVSYLSC